MNATADLKLLGIAEVNGQPLACGACGNTFSLEVHKRGPFETGSAWICCLACGAGRESADVTNGLVDAVLAGWCEKREDVLARDTFAAEWRGTYFTGELVPTLDFHQAKVAVEAWHEVAAPEVKRWWRGKQRAAKAKAKAPLRAAKKKAGEATGSVKASALSAAWTMQTGGAGLPGPRAVRGCPVKGCRRGWLTIRTRVHSSTGKKGSVRVRCAVCTRTDDVAGLA
ncbi:hypothetical protein OG411_29950 [Streptomyces pseudogriseolus]|uniref:hypothetical protein n=1 Tax=Streptomyces pseudogriseolus TaxID=36817 RepID=UPI00324676B6